MLLCFCSEVMARGVGCCAVRGIWCCAGRDTGAVGGDRMDFFVSHAGADRAWAEWVAWQLAEAGYTVELDVWDWAAGPEFRDRDE